MLETSGLSAETRPGMKPRPPRKNVMLAASISAGTVSAPVRIRNLSEAGAMIDGPALPSAGSTLMLSRLELSVTATVVWNRDGRCGLSLRAPITVDDWIAGVRTAAANAGLGQLRVDRIQSAIRSGEALPSETCAPAPKPVEADTIAPRIADELARVKRMLDSVGEQLADDVDVLMRHERAMQTFDIAAQIVDELSTVMSADDPVGALAGVQMHELRSRLAGQPTLT